MGMSLAMKLVTGVLGGRGVAAWDSGLLEDGDMEAAGVSAWTPLQSASLTKETTNPYEGKQVMRIASTGSSNIAARQYDILTIGTDYRIIGRMRSDGNFAPAVSDGVQALFTGTVSTDWQEVDVTFTAQGTLLSLWMPSSGGPNGPYIEVDAFGLFLA